MYPGRTVWGIFSSVCLVSSVVINTGCSSSDSHAEVFPVTGQVFHNGQPAAGATILLFIVGDDLRGQRIPIPQAVVDTEGKYHIGCYEKDDGAPAGEYRAAVVWHDSPAGTTLEEGQAPNDRLKGRYADPRRSGLTATIIEGKNTLPPFQL